MLPLNQLESLSEAHADILKKKADLSKKMLEIEFNEAIEKLTKHVLEKAETEIMEAVKKGKKNTSITTYEPRYNTNNFGIFYANRPSDETNYVARKVVNELKNQGFFITRNEFHSDHASYNISWQNFKPNPNYKQPDFEKTIKKLQEKITKLNNLNKQADKIITE